MTPIHSITLEYLAVSGPQQGEGFGTQIMKAVEDEILDGSQGKPVSIQVVPRGNSDVFYEKIGYEPGNDTGHPYKLLGVDQAGAA